MNGLGSLHKILVCILDEIIKKKIASTSGLKILGGKIMLY